VCYAKRNFYLKKIVQHENDDSFIFILSYNKLRYRVYVYGDYSYMVILPTKLTESWFHNYAQLLATVETLMENFLCFCPYTVNRDHIYNCEQEIGYYLLITFGIHVFDWDIWYALFSRPYSRFRVLGRNWCTDDLWTFFQILKL
jgi:hypothetical protein